MARSIATIKKSITDEFMANEYIQKAYDLDSSDVFSQKFSKVSIESILFYIFAVAAYTLETLMDSFKSDVEELIDNMTPHRAKWYRDKVLDFMYDMELVDDTDEYDTSSMSDADIEAAMIVKYAAAVDSSDSSLLIIKVAGGDDDNREPLDYDESYLTDDGNYEGEQYTALQAYIDQIKDAGVRYNLVNKYPNEFTCKLEVHYNALKVEAEMDASIRSAIKEYIQNLPFNGEYTNMALVDALQELEGVKIVEFNDAYCDGKTVGAKIIPSSGYFTVNDIYEDINLTLEPYAMV